MSTTELIKNNPALGLAAYLKEFVSLRTKTIRDVSKYDSGLYFSTLQSDLKEKKIIKILIEK